MKPVKDIKPTSDIKYLVKQLGEAGGFTAKHFSKGVEIFQKMTSDKDCTKFLSFPACIMATGTRGVLVDLVKNKKVDIIITTCGTVDHDISRFKHDYYHGSFQLDDKELHKKDMHRLGNIVIPMKNHGAVIEDFTQPLLEELYKQKKEWNTYEILWEFGKRMDKSCLLYWTWKNKIPVFLPGPLDGSWGTQLWMFWQTHRDFKLNLFEDEQKIYDIVNGAKKSGALLLGGGISKHHVIWHNQFRSGLDYAIQISTAVEWDGSLSGAKTKEAISWGKIREDATHVTIPGDVTVLLPILVSAL